MTEQTATRALPAPWSITLTAVCQECGKDLSRTIGDDLFPWFHKGTGSETCEG